MLFDRRTLGLVGHFLDQRRLKQPLYRDTAASSSRSLQNTFIGVRVFVGYPKRDSKRGAIHGLARGLHAGEIASSLQKGKKPNKWAFRFLFL